MAILMTTWRMLALSKTGRLAATIIARIVQTQCALVLITLMSWA